ncbi:MAG TPA: type VI secretion system-associated protein TagF [Polyangiaceae bacterium]|jgi:type VI secretion system ImpM family protein
MEPLYCGRVDLMGKVPWRNEYVRPSAPTPMLTGFDKWLGDSVETATRGAARWGDAYAAATLHAFVFAPAKKTGSVSGAMEILAGVVAPSEDGAGRQYPVSLLGTIALPSAVTSTPEVLPLLVEDFWQSASDLLTVTRAAGPSAFEQSIGALQTRFEFTVDGARGAYGQWTAALMVSELTVLLFGVEPSRSPEKTMQDVVEALRPFRAIENPRTPLTLKLPLGSAAGAAVCFWVDFVRRAARWRGTLPSFFWSHDGNSGTMLLHLGDPPQSTLAELWGPKRDRDEVFDLTQTSVSPAAEVAVAPAPEPRFLSNPSEPVSEFLARVAVL